MATLGSPGVQVSVVDESFYNSAAPGTVPLIFVATEQDKINGSSSGTAQGTTAANLGKVWTITSQRDLADTFGTPLFYTNNGNPIHGGELNEYGLQTAYSLLGVSSRVYVVRADVDLKQLKPTTSAPSGNPVAGTYWLDTANSLFGINEWNSVTQKFTTKTPLIIDDKNKALVADLDGDEYIPIPSFGNRGDYAMVVTSNNTNSVWYRTSSKWVEVTAQSGNEWDDAGAKKLAVSPHYSYPNFSTSTGNSAATGSVWVKTTTPGLGAHWMVKYYNGATQAWTSINAPVYDSARQALEKIDYAGGGKNIAVGTVFVESDPKHYRLENGTSTGFKLWRRSNSGATVIVSSASTATSGISTEFTIRETLASGTRWGDATIITIPGSITASIASQIPLGIGNSTLKNITATWDPVTTRVTITHKLGGDFQLVDGAGNPLATVGFTAYNPTNKTGTVNLYVAPANDQYEFSASNWKPLVYQAQAAAPVTRPVDGKLWYDSNMETVDIMYNNGAIWKGYRNAFPTSDPNGPIISATQPKVQSLGGDLVTGDIWIDSSDPDMYGHQIYVWDADMLQWVMQDVADQGSPTGWVFADARWSDNGRDAPDYITPVTDLLVSNYVDPDCLDPHLYPTGTRLWNLRRSGFNVKQYMAGHINIKANNGVNIRYENDNMSNYSPDRWVTVSANNEDGSGKFGRLAQRGYVVGKLKATIDTNEAVRDTDALMFNLMACPGYPEVIQNMVAFNTDRGQTAFIVGDTPFRLEPTATALSNWGNNTALAYDNGDDGAVSYDSYMGMFYPSGYTTDNTGLNKIVVPPSHMILRTILNSDNVSYPWFAPAGTRRGSVDNATSVGYITKEGEFKTASLYEGLRNVMHDVKINPIATLPGVGLVNFGQYTRAKAASALDRINVARLVCYLRHQLSILAKPYLFEPNDSQTRNEIKAAVESLLIELVGNRALYDFIVVCDTSNNTRARIDRSELWVDVAIEPVKAVEFIYIPLRLKKTGEISSGKLG
jgi:hypothetical protein